MSLDEISFGIENFQSILEELYPLWRQHHNELVGKETPLKPNIELYLQLQRNKRLVVFTVRSGTGHLIGYSFFILSEHIHRTQVLKADNDLFFITKRFRKGWLAAKFIRYCEKKLFESNINQIYMRTKVRASFGPLLERCGYKAEEVLYIKKKE